MLDKEIDKRIAKPAGTMAKLNTRALDNNQGHCHILKDVIYEELATKYCLAGLSALCFKDICKHDLKLADIDLETWDLITNDYIS